MVVKVLMMSEKEVEGKMVKRFKMVDFEEDVRDYAKYGSPEKVKEVFKEKVKKSNAFEGFDVDELLYKWDKFLLVWKEERKKEMKRKKNEQTEELKREEKAA